MGREGADKITAGGFYVAVVLTVLLFGSKTLVPTPPLEKALAGFHHRAEGWMDGMGPKCQPDRMWLYSPIGAAMVMVGLEEIGVYIARLQNTVAQYISTRTIMNLFLAAERNPGMHLSRKCWEQPAIGIMGISATR